MATNYTINWSNDTLKPPFTVIGATLNNTNTSLVLPGRDAVSWGESYNENLIRMLENFASSTAPLNPTLGQMWFNATLDTMNVYYGGEWHPIQYNLSTGVVDNSDIITQGYALGTLTAPSGTYDWDMSTGMIKSITLTGNAVFNLPTNARIGTYMLFIRQHATTAYTITWNAGFKWPYGTTPDISGLNSFTIVTIVYTGAEFRCSYTPYES